MPRPLAIRKDLSNGWQKLHSLWKRDLPRKIEDSHRLLKKISRQHAKQVVCWSGGKDSTVVLHLALQHIPDIPVIYVDSGVEFSESKNFVSKLANSWNLNLTIARPKTDEDFWSIGSKFGWPILGKSIASNVERAVRTGNIRPQMSRLEKMLAMNGVRISARCSEFIQERPSMEAESVLQADAKIIGLRASESRARVRLWVDHGDHYFVKRYFGRNRGIWKVNPIAVWTEQDIWDYHKIHQIPHCKIYDKGYPRNGCWPCAMGFRNGQLKRLRTNHPVLFKHLVLETQMGQELLKIKLVASKLKDVISQPKSLIRLLENEPGYFDGL